MPEIFHELFVFDMADNHQGRVDQGLRILEAVAGIRDKNRIHAGVKFPLRRLDSLIHPDHKQTGASDYISRLLSAHLDMGQCRSLADRARELGLTPIGNPFDEASVEQCLLLRLPVIAMAGGQANDWPLLETAAETGLPVLASTIGLGLDGIDSLAAFLSHKQIRFALMHGAELSPAPAGRLQMGFMDRLLRRYPGHILGYIGREAPGNLAAVGIAVAKGAQVLERRVGLADGESELDAGSSSTPEQAEAWVAAAQQAREICGPGDRRLIDKKQKGDLLLRQRGVFAAQKIEKAEYILPEHVYFALPRVKGQVTAGEFGSKWARFKASREYRPDEPLMNGARVSRTGRLRALIHRCKYMVIESGAVLGGGLDIALSHPRGADNAPGCGALIITVFKRGYGKRLFAMAASQAYPAHRHLRTEKNLQLLWGDLTVTRNGIETRMPVGGNLPVEPGAWHGFRTKGGAVFEEIFSGSQAGDLVFRDPAIQDLDPIERITPVEKW